MRFLGVVLVHQQTVPPEIRGGTKIADARQYEAVRASWLKRSLASRCHHLLMTHYTGPGGWADQQLPDGSVIWTAPSGLIAVMQPNAGASNRLEGLERVMQATAE